MRGNSIMVVEDERIVAADLAHCLRLLGYVVTERVTRGEEAVQRCERARPDLVLMDILLPGPVDGIQAADEITRRLDIPVVFVTASSDETTLTRAKETGPFGFIVKPFDDRGLHTTIELALFKHQSERRLRESEERYRLLFETAPVPIHTVDNDGCLLRVNEAWMALLGYGRDEAIGRWFGDFLTPSSVDRFVANVRTCRQGVVAAPVLLDLVRKDKGICPGTVRGAVAVDQRGRGEVTQCIIEASPCLSAHFAPLPDRSARPAGGTDGVWPAGDVAIRVDSAGRIAGVTGATEDLTGWTAEELCGTPLRGMLFDPGDADLVRHGGRDEDPSPWRLVQVQRRQGGHLEAEMCGFTFRGKNNRPEGKCLILKQR